MNKAFSRVNWKNLPSKSTPISEANLNRSDSALDIIDNRVIDLDTKKADKSTLNSLVSDVLYNESTGTFIIKKYDGSTKSYDTELEKVAVNFVLAMKEEPMYDYITIERKYGSGGHKIADTLAERLNYRLYDR